MFKVFSAIFLDNLHIFNNPLRKWSTQLSKTHNYNLELKLEGVSHERPQGRARGALAPPGRPRLAKNSMFLGFFGKNSIFFDVF
jgi:hypothetical protein